MPLIKERSGRERMLRMDPVHVIRHKHHKEGLGIRKIARDMGLDHKTIRKYLKDDEPIRIETETRACPVMEAPWSNGSYCTRLLLAPDPARKETRPPGMNFY